MHGKDVICFGKDETYLPNVKMSPEFKLHMFVTSSFNRDLFTGVSKLTFDPQRSL